MNIRPATLDDLAAIYEIEFQEYNHRGYDFVTFRQFLDIFEGTFLVAEENTKTGFTVSAISNNCRDGWVLSLLVRQKIQSANESCLQVILLQPECTITIIIMTITAL
ncbi:MAG: hypothetical protein HKP41_20205 [Desulfobacterales bacterium]|nr:hypothetical protein [Desulfobacterales bacterium]